jgi:hypothetical protein
MLATVPELAAVEERLAAELNYRDFGLDERPPPGIE